MNMAWQPKIDSLQDLLASEESRLLAEKKLQAQRNTVMQWPPPPAMPVAPPYAPGQIPGTAPEKYNPFQIDKDLPLWAKGIKIATLPFQLVQDYLFNPLLAGIHQPWAKGNLDSNELKIAQQQGILSYFPGGIRYKSYEELKYPGKWAVEMLPWLIVPPIGAVGAAGIGGRGIAGALGRLGKAGAMAGKALEYSPAGLGEKAISGIVGKVTGRVASKLASQLPEDPLVTKMNTVIRSAQAKLPEQKVLTHELRVAQLTRAMPELEKASGEKALYNFMKALKGTGEKVEWQGIRSQLTQKEINQLSNMIRESPKVPGFSKAPAISGWRKVLDGTELPFDSELEQLEKIFGQDFVSALIEKRAGNIINKISDVANAPRAVLASVDLSGLLRQGAILSARHPIEALKTVKPMLKSFLSDNNAKLVDDIIQARPHSAIMAEHGMYLAPIPSKTSVALSKMEESFMSHWIEKVPVIGSLVKASNRAYVTVLNDLRSRTAESTLSMWERLGQQITDVDYKELSKLINAASGRGSLPKALLGASPLMNATLFSPRLLISRLQFPAKIFSPSPLVRKEAARMLVQFLGVGTGIVGMANLAGAKTELDPRSADFGKIIIGNTRLDVWTGYSQWARFIAQLVTAARKTQGGNIRDVNRREVVDRFMQSKYSPAFGLLNDILRGESYMGEEVNLDTTSLQRQAWSRFVPLFIQDLIDAIDQEGLIGGVIASPGLLGVGVVTYMSPTQKFRNQLAQERYGVSWDELGAQQGISAQLDLERSSPQLLALAQKEKEDYDKSLTGKTDIYNVYSNQVETIENEFKRSVNLAAQELRDTGDGYAFKEKIMEYASNRRSQYEILNRDPQFSKVVARYDELPTAADLKKTSPQDLARKEYMRLLYSSDMYDQYGNYRFDMVDDIKSLFVQVFGQNMLDYIETYQGVKDSNYPLEYQEFKKAQKILRPYWEVANQIAEVFSQRFADSPRGQRLIAKRRKRIRQTNREIEYYYQMFYSPKT